MEARVAVLVSGSGTNLQALIDDPVVRPWIVLVLSDRPEAYALERAGARGIETAVITVAEHPDRPAFNRAVRDFLLAEDVEYVVSAGYMRVVPELAQAFPGRWLNIHPALLPSFPGGHGVRDALAWGVKVTGVTVHLVDEELDHGPIVAQEAVEVRPDDDRDSLEARIHEIEHRLLPAAVRALVEGRLRVEGRIVHVLPEAGG